MNRKIKKINDFCKVIAKYDYNSFDTAINFIFSHCMFEKMKLSQFYFEGSFNYHCQVGSFVCAIALGMDCNLVRGELLPKVRGERFEHGWIETKFDGVDFVIDTSLGRTIPKELYYRYLKPRVNRVISRENLLENDFARYLSQALLEDNNLDLSTMYEVWWPYEDTGLANYKDNSLLNNWSLDNPMELKKLAG